MHECLKDVQCQHPAASPAIGVLQLPSSAAKNARSVTTATRVSSWLRADRYFCAGSSSVLQGKEAMAYIYQVSDNKQQNPFHCLLHTQWPYISLVVLAAVTVATLSPPLPSCCYTKRPSGLKRPVQWQISRYCAAAPEHIGQRWFAC